MASIPQKPDNLVAPSDDGYDPTEEPFFSTSLLFNHIAYFTFRRPPKNDTEFELYKKALEAYYDNHPRFLYFFDIRDLDGVNEYFIWKKAELMDFLKPRTQKAIVCTAVVLNSEPVRMLLNGFFTLYEFEAPHQIFTTDADATEWLTQWLVTEFGADETMRCLGV